MPLDPHDLDEKVTALRSHAERQGQSISAIVETAMALAERVRNLESYVQQRAVMEARDEERDKALYEKLAEIKADIAGIRTFGQKIQWTVIVTVIGAIVAFIIKGKLI